MWKILFKVMLFSLVVSPVNLSSDSQAKTTSFLPGLIVRPVVKGLEISALASPGKPNRVDVVPIERGGWQYFALSPDQEKFAVVTLDVTDEFRLEVHHLTEDGFHRRTLPPTLNPEVGYKVDWSSDSINLLISPSNFLEPPLLYDTVRQSLISFETSFASHVRWANAPTRMWFYSLPVFDERGRAFTDLYLAHYRDQSININPITRLNIHELGLQDRQTTKYIFISAETYHPPEHRIYLSLREAEINPGGFEFLYSTDFEGNLRFEADIAALDLHSQLPTVIRQIFSNPSDDTLYLVTYTEGIGENHLIGRISVLRLNRDKTLEHLYVYNFDRFDETISRFITSSKLSPDGQYLAIGLSTSAHIGTGRLIVIDLMRGDVVTEQAISRQVCQVFWSDDSFQVIYTQTDQRACVRYFENLPVNRLVAYDVLTDTSQVLIEDATLPFYFLANQ